MYYALSRPRNVMQALQEGLKDAWRVNLARPTDGLIGSVSSLSGKAGYFDFSLVLDRQMNIASEELAAAYGAH
jgi:hypothetical protein